MPHMTEPARRHLCEICKTIFECHLCTMRAAHISHSSCFLASDVPVFVCENCAEAENMRYLVTPTGIVNYLTGQWIRRYAQRDTMARLTWSAKP